MKRKQIQILAGILFACLLSGHTMAYGALPGEICNCTPPSNAFRPAGTAVTSPFAGNLDFAANHQICAGGTANYGTQADTGGENTVSWSISPASGHTILSGANARNVKVQWNTPGTYTLSFVVATVADPNCTSTNSLVVVVNSLPTVPAPNVSSKAFCYGDPAASPPNLANTGVNVAGTLAAGQRIVWVLTGKPENSAYTLQQEFTVNNCGNASRDFGELLVASNSRVIRVNSISPANGGVPIHGTYTFTAYREICATGCKSALAGTYTIQVKAPPVLAPQLVPPFVASGSPIGASMLPGFHTNNGVGIGSLDFLGKTVAGGLTEAGNAQLPALGQGTTFIDADSYVNASGDMATATYTVVANGANGCKGEPADYSFTVMPAQNSIDSVILMNIKARAVSDTSIVVRWTPPDYDTWRLGMTNGYRVLRRMIAPDGQMSQVFVPGIIKPTPEAAWPNPSDNEYLALAKALCYDFSQSVYEGPQGAFTAREDRESRYNFTLLAADISAEAAKEMGLLFADTGLLPGFVYEYKVVLVNSPVQSLFTEVNPADTPPLPTPANVEAEFGKDHFFLSWDKAGLEEFYTSYTIEYSEDMGATFQPMHEKRFVYFENDNLPAALQTRIVYKDSISAAVPEYQFRVKGHTCFGETGPVSAVVSGASVPDPVPVVPRISEVRELMDSTFQITWNINEAVADSVVAFNVWRYPDLPGEGIVLNAAPLPPAARSFNDANPLNLGYYRVEAIDAHGYGHYSFTVVGQRYDTIPPAIPMGLYGVIDSLTDSTMLVQLQWTANQDADLLGYYVYRSNGRHQEFTHLTNSAHWEDVIFYDTIPAITLADSIFYRIKAVDFKGNISGFSEIASIARPDLVAPSPPMLRHGTDSDGGLSWVNSHSRDVNFHRIERRVAGSEGAWEAVEVMPKSNHSMGKIAPDVVQADSEIEYAYRVVAIDKVGLETPSNEVVVRESPLKKKFTSTYNFDLSSQYANGVVTLTWDSGYPFGIEKVIVYRSRNEGPFLSLLHLEASQVSAASPNRAAAIDSFIEDGQKYFYKIQVKFDNGEYSNVSDMTIIRL